TPVPAKPTPTPKPTPKPTPVPQMKPVSETSSEAPTEENVAIPPGEVAPNPDSESTNPIDRLARDIKRHGKLELTFDGQYSRAFTNLSDNGFGGMIRAEYRFPRL